MYEEVDPVLWHPFSQEFGDRDLRARPVLISTSPALIRYPERESAPTPPELFQSLGRLPSAESLFSER